MHLLNDKLECIVVEISSIRLKLFLVATWYRLPNSPTDFFSHFETVLNKDNNENSEFHLLGDLNCNMFSSPECNSCISGLLNFLDIFRFSF